jgi:hypothetical protein
MLSSGSAERACALYVRIRQENRLIMDDVFPGARSLPSRITTMTS